MADSSHSSSSAALGAPQGTALEGAAAAIIAKACQASRSPGPPAPASPTTMAERLSSPKRHREAGYDASDDVRMGQTGLGGAQAPHPVSENAVGQQPYQVGEPAKINLQVNISNPKPHPLTVSCAPFWLSM